MIRNFLSQGFRGLPVVLGGAILFLGLVQGNFNFLFFFAGMFILAPTVAILINGLWELLFSNTPSYLTIPEQFWKVSGSSAEACNLFVTGVSSIFDTINTVPSIWMTMMSFFFAYLFSNALSLYNKQETSVAPINRVRARKSQASISMAIIVAVGIIITILRSVTSCETGLGIGVSWILGGTLGYSWYEYMKNCGLGRLDDLFGINNRILPNQSYEDSDPTVCIPDTQK